MTHHPLGAACVVDSAGCLIGLVRPTAIGPEARLLDALRLMEDRPSQISVLPVVDSASGRCLGLIRLHDIYKAEL